MPNGTSSSRERSKKKQRTEDGGEGNTDRSVTAAAAGAAAASKRNCDSETANPTFPQGTSETQIVLSRKFSHKEISKVDPRLKLNNCAIYDMNFVISSALPVYGRLFK